MQSIRIKPGRCYRSKRELRTWYVIVLGFKPPGFKHRPYVHVYKRKLPMVFKALNDEFNLKYH